jgi:hypothetical protein
VKLRENKTFANYRAKSIPLMKEYNNIEKEYVSEELKNRLIQLQVEALKKTDNIEASIKENPADYAELIKATNEYNEGIAVAREMFMIGSEFKFAREVCDIVYEDCDFDKLLEEKAEYEDLIKFLSETFQSFFLKNKNIINIVLNLKQPLTTETIQ